MPSTRCSYGLPTLRVLVVDDDRGLADALLLCLKRWGYEARAAHDGPEALEAAGAYQPDVVLLDLSLPRLDGCEVARRLRDRVGLLVAATGRGEQGDGRLCQQAGFDYLLPKPFDPELLRRLLQARAG